MHMTADVLIETLRKEGLRVTAPRRAICDVIAEAHDDHLTAANILDAARARSDAKIDPSTVYRTLEALEAAGSLTHSHLGHGPSVFHLTEEAAHQHLVCARCDRTVAIHQRDLSGFLEEITLRTGFVPDPTHFALSGLCESCSRMAGTDTIANHLQ